MRNKQTIFEDARFLSLSTEEKLIWLYLRDHALISNAPGLFYGSSISLVEMLYPANKEDVVSDSLKNEIVKTAIEKFIDFGWLEYDLQNQLFWITTLEQTPKNRQMLHGWLKALKEIQCSPLRQRWLAQMCGLALEQFGDKDVRFHVLDQLCESLARNNLLVVDKYQKKGVYNHYPFEDDVEKYIDDWIKKKLLK